MQWWADWWAEHGVCTLSSEAACMAQRIEAVKARKQREAANIPKEEEQKKQKHIKEYRGAAFSEIRRCARNGEEVCAVAPVYGWRWHEQSDADNERHRLLTDMRRIGYNCNLGVVEESDDYNETSHTYDGIVCDLLNPLPTRVNSDA